MSEPFQSFGSNFRVTYSSIIAFSMTGILGVSAITFTGNFLISSHSKMTYAVSCIAYGVAILLSFVSIFIGLNSEKEEGASTSSSGQRELNRAKFTWLLTAGIFAAVGLAGTLIHFLNLGRLIS